MTHLEGEKVEVLRQIAIPWAYRGEPVFMQVVRLTDAENSIRLVFSDGTALSRWEEGRMAHSPIRRRAKRRT